GPVRGRPELLLAVGPGRCGDCVSGLPGARDRVRVLRAAGGRLADRQVPPQRELPRGLAHDTATRGIPRVCNRARVRRARPSRRRGARARRVDGRARPRLAARPRRDHRRPRRPDSARASRPCPRRARPRPRPRRGRPTDGGVCVSLLVLNDEEVRELLDMQSCVEAMEEVLAALQRGELSMPLRFMFRPPNATSLFGFMPAHRAGGAPMYSLKEIVVSPANSAQGLDPHQGAVMLHDGETGKLVALMNASAVTEIRTAAVSGVATKLLARPGSRVVAVLGAGVQGRSHIEAMRAVLDDPEIRLWSRGTARAGALAEAT